MSLSSAIGEGWETVQEHGLYLWECILHSHTTAAIAPTNQRVIDALVELTPPGTKRVLELGAGSGRLIRALLESGRIDEGGTIAAIERNPNFSAFMKKKICGNFDRHGLGGLYETEIQDRSVKILEGNAEDLHRHQIPLFGSHKPIDRVYASLPFSFMKKTRGQIFEAVREVLAQDGEFIVYIFEDIREALEEVFDDVTMERVPGQLLPPRRYAIHRARTQTPLLLPVSSAYRANGASHSTLPFPRRW